jgi:hypothetical protein
MIKWILICAAIVGLSCITLCTGQNTSFAGFEGTLLGLNLSVAVLAINFSFVAYQSSEYRQFQRGLAPNLLFGCLVMLWWAMIPALSLVFYRSGIGLIALAAIPVTGLLSIALVELAKYEASPEALVRNLATASRRKNAFKDYGKVVSARKTEWGKQKLSKPEDMPTHEWSWVPLPPPSKSDPFFLLGSIGCVASKASNAGVVVIVTQEMLKAYSEFYQVYDSTRNNIPHEVGGLIEAQLERLCQATETDSTGYLSARFLDVCAIHLINASNTPDPQIHAFSFVAHLLANSGRTMIEKGHLDAARIPLIAIRQCCLKGVYEIAARAKDGKEPDINSLFFDHTLGNVAAIIKPLGTAAITAGQSDYLYRVFDAFGWLGCTALKNGNREVTKTCLRALAQLGREARAKKLECHWDRCALLPEQHARERIQWVMSWITKEPEATRDSWLPLCAQALSRITGKEITLTVEKKGDQVRIVIQESDEEHMEGYSADGGSRQLDYSDINMLKDFELYGGGGMVMQGPTIPFKIEKSE